MPNVNQQGIRIYYQFEGTGEPLVLHHGLSDSLWGVRALGYVERLKEHFQVIMLDARGHGYSDKPHDPAAYAPESLVNDVCAVLDALQVRQAHYLGYSLGGWVGLGLAQHAPERLRSLVVGGAHPFATNFGFYRQLFAQSIDGWITNIEHTYGPLSHTVRQYLRNNDNLALQALVAQDRPALWSHDYSLTVPTLFFAGTADPLYPLIQCAAQAHPAATLASLAGLDHYAVYLRSDLVIPLFLQQVARLTGC